MNFGSLSGLAIGPIGGRLQNFGVKLALFRKRSHVLGSA